MRTLKEIMGDENRVSFLTRCAMDFRHWFENVFGFTWEDYYTDWIYMVQNNKYVAIEAFTGSGKSEVLGIAYPLWLAWFHEDRKMLIISKTLPQSTSILQRIKDHIEGNELLRELIPQNRPESAWCSKSEMKLSTGCYVSCKPYSKNLKGYHVHYILADEVATYEDQVIFFNILVTRAVANDGTLVAISTPENIADLMQNVMANPNFKSGIYPAERDGVPTSRRFSKDKLDNIKATLGDSAYGREYLCDPKTEVESALFPPRIILPCYKYDMTFREQSNENTQVFFGIDLAISDSPKSDFDCYVVIEKFGDHCTILTAERHRGYPIKAKVERISFLFDQYKPEMIFIDESNVGMAVIEELRNKSLPIEGVSFHSRGRSQLLVNLRQLLEKEKVDIPKCIDESGAQSFAETLTKEMLGFTESKLPSGNIVYLSRADHDDTVMALALACKGVSDQKECLDYIAM